MDFTTIFTKTTTVVPQKVFDRLWVQQINISAPTPTGDATARISFKKFAVTDGEVFLSDEPPINLDLNSLFLRAETDAELAGIMSSLMAYVHKVADAQGIAAPVGATGPANSVAVDINPILDPINDVPEA